jgi:HAD superfamily hydrolase (TIGR01549 family)
MKKPAVIFFDIGGTLATGMDRTPRRALAELLGLSDKEAAKAGRLLMTHPAGAPAALSRALALILPGKAPDLIESAVNRLWDEHFESIRPIEGASALLRKIREKGVRLGIVSNTWAPAYSGFCRACPEILPLFDYTVLSYRSGCKKPQEAIFRLALDLCGRPASECWMVGDIYEQDVYPAGALGFHTVWVLVRPEREKASLARILRGEIKGPDFTVEEIREVLNLVERF